MSRVGPLLSPLLVGRDDLLVQADRRLEDAAAGRGQVLLLAGEAGIGKTRLLRAILRKANAAGFRIARGDLAPQDRLVPLASTLDLARTMNEVPAFGSLGAEVIALVEGHAARGADSLGSRRMLVRDLAERLATHIDVPTVLAFEDLQWADEMSLEVIAELARLLVDKPALVIAAYRADELPFDTNHREWRANLLSQRRAEEARLAPLTYDETALVTSLILATGLPAPREVVTAVYERTDGIPLHVEELLGALDDDARSDGHAIRNAQVPSTIEDAILARFGRLSEDARAVARAGAVMGRCFVPEVLAGIMDRQVTELEDAFEELVDRSFLYTFESVDHGYYDFRHQLLRDALYGTVPPQELRRLHARAGEFGAELVGANEIHASVHFERAGLRAQAFRAALAGARAASAISSRHEAFVLYGRAVANLPDGLPATELADLYFSYCEAASAVDNMEVMERTARLARGYSLEAGRPLDAAYGLLDLAIVARKSVRPGAEVDALLDEAATEFLALPPSPEREYALSEIATQQGINARNRADLDAAGALFDEARRLRRASNDPDTADIDYPAAEIDILAGRIDDGLGTMMRIAREARARNQESLGVTAYRWTAAMATRVMAYPTGRECLAEGLRYANEIEQSYCRHIMAATGATIAWADGSWDEAIPTAEIELVEPGSKRSTIGSRDALGFVAFGRGDIGRARMLLTEAVELARPTDEIDLLMPPLWGLAETELVAGDIARAIDHCEAGFTIALETGERPLFVPFVVTGVRAYQAARRPEGAEDWLARCRERLAGWERAIAALDHGEGLVRLASGATVSARTSLEAAVAGWDDLGRIWESTWARLDLAACLIRGNRHADAVPFLEESREVADRLQSPPLRDRAAELMAIARRRGLTEEPWRPLTGREFEVARLVADGLTNVEIARELGLSPKTVSAHLEHILAKLGATRRAEVAAWVATVRLPEGVAAGAR